ncbi:MAG: deoxyribose-phosphate aldolase [Gemmatimonadota bacterium]|nr:MAG: deoxyribose-phosphate aldolase [Gemmatimonadota bacterium]
MDRAELDRITARVLQEWGGRRRGAVPSSSGSLQTGEGRRISTPGLTGPATLSRLLAPIIDHTLLTPSATEEDILRLCDEAVQYHFAAVCVAGGWVPTCVRRLQDVNVGVVSVAGFPGGAATTAEKVLETSELTGLGATEVDVVAPIERIQDSDWDYVADDIAAVVDAAEGRLVKVILETACLEPELIVKGALVAQQAGAGFVKTSTGLHPAGGATVPAVSLLRLAVGDELGVKASGGIRRWEAAFAMVSAGATRIGTSHGVALVRPYGD